MTNAKSRLVRIIALALAVLMVVPMALVGCKKTDAGVDQAAIDAAIKEALDAAQKAQDAADKAAQDAKDAQDKLAAAEKEAADLQGQIDAMKNTTTAAPATTTKAPVAEDAKVVDAYIADMLYNNESEFKKLDILYSELKDAYLGIDTDSADAKAIADTIATAKIAIQRAPSVDYVNQLVAALAADLDAIPTISERVKAAYDAIDFAADNDIVDVAYANALLAEANKILAAASSSVKEVAEFFAAEKKALKSFGEEKLDLAKLIADEYVRYADSKDGIYADAFAYAEAALVEKIEKLFNNDAELDVEEIVYGVNANEDVIEAIEDLYDEFYKLYKKDFAEYQDALEIAVVGEKYLLKAEGNFLREKLAAAKERVVELEAAAEEFKATKELSGKNGVAAIVKAYTEGYGDAATGADFIFNAKTNAKIAAIDELLAAWMAKYSFDAEDENLDAIIGAGAYDSFVEVKAVMNFVNEWAAKLDAISASDIEEAIDALKDTDARIDYAEQGAAVKALYTWYNGTYKQNKDTKLYESNKDGVLAAELKINDAKIVKIDTANIDAMLDDTLEITKDQVKTLTAALEVFEGAYLSGKKADTTTAGAVTSDNAILAIVKEIEKKADKLDLEALATEDLAAIAAIAKDIDDLCVALGFEEDEDAEFGYAIDSKNYGVVPFDVLAAIEDAKEALVGDLLAKAAEIVKAYIGWKGAYDEDEEAVKFDGKYYDVDVVEISAFSYPLVSKLAADYNAIKIFDLDEKVVLEDIDEVEVKFTADEVVEFYRAINDEFYYGIMEKIHDVAWGLYAFTTSNAAVYSTNDWMKYGAASTATLNEYKAAYGQYGLKYVFPTSSSDKGTGNDINVYATTAGIADDTKTYIKAIEDVDAHKYAVKNADGLTIGFDVAAYKAAVDANIAAYRTAWYAKYLAKTSNATAINAKYNAVIANAIAYALWTIEGEFELNDEAYTFVVNADKTVTVYDDADEKVAEVEAEDGTKYTFKAVLENNKVVIKTNNDKLLADVDDDATADAPKYEYVLADAIAEIVASSKTIGTIKKADHASNTYNVYNEKYLNALNDAFNTNQFYVFRDAKVAAANVYLEMKDTDGDGQKDAYVYSLDIVNLAREFKGVWKDVKHDKVTKAEIEDAYKALVSQVAKFTVAE